ncbi:MAG: hypothetical protein KC422_21455 [Trueperaceae bacterium]|nr:hypothetical protein [Trueperaceae bacterium]
MKRLSVLMFSLVFMAAGFVFAQNFFGIPYLATDVEFTDEGFDYTAEDYGYIHLSRSADVVMVTLDDSAQGGIKLNYDEIAELDEAGDYNQSYIDTYYQGSAGIEVANLGIDIAFKNAQLEEVTDYFLAELQAMNFNPVEVVGTANTYAFDCGCNVNADYHLRATFTQLGSTVFAHLSVVM